MSYGLTFKTLHSENDFDLTMMSDNRQILSGSNRQTAVITGFGTVDFGVDTPNEKPLKVTFSYCATSLEDLREKMELISGWLYDDGSFHSLIFDDAPNRKYNAKVISTVDLSQNGLVGLFSVEFLCNPHYPFALDNSPVSPADVQSRLLWDTATLNEAGYIQTFAADGDMRFTVGGVASVKPVIKIIGYIESGLTLTYGTDKWQYDANLIYDGIKIDCDNETVIRLSDGANLVPYVNSTYKAYFNIAIGQQKISIEGVGGAFPNNLTITVEFTPIQGG